MTISLSRRLLYRDSNAKKIASDILDFADAGDVTILALLDLSAAFDSVDYGILLQRLKLSYGICGSVLRWMQSFLSNCCQTVQFADKQSFCSTLTCEVRKDPF